MEIDLVTGGGKGLMEVASLGHKQGKKMQMLELLE